MTYVYSQPIFSFSSWAGRAATMYEVQKSWLLTTGNWNIIRGSTCLLSQRVYERRWILTEISLKEISALSFCCWVISTAFHLDRCLVQPPQCSSLSQNCHLKLSAAEPAVLLISIVLVLFHFLGIILGSRKEIIQIEVICVCHSTRCSLVFHWFYCLSPHGIRLAKSWLCLYYGCLHVFLVR